MKVLGLIRFLSLGLVIATYFVVTTPLYAFVKISPYRAKKTLSKLVGIYSKLLLLIMNIKVKVRGDFSKSKNALIVSNHLSYLDILSISSVLPSSYITSVEMKKTFLLGPITQLAGCLYVERRSRNNIQNEIVDIDNALKCGLNVTFFPESKSTNGEEVLSFKRSLFQSAINVSKPILPLTIKYRKLNGEDVSKENRDILCWYDDMDFFPHIWKLCFIKGAQIELHFSELITEHYGREDITTAHLRDKAFEVICDKYIQIT